MNKYIPEEYFYNNNFDTLLNDFKKQKQIVLFLGAGINVSGNNGMDWNALMAYLFDEAISFLSIEKRFDRRVNTIIKKLFRTKEISENEQSGQKEETDDKINIENGQWNILHEFVYNEFTPLVKASIIKEILGKNYITSIQNFLYSKCNKKVLETAFEKCYILKDGVDYPSPGEYYSLYQLARLILFSPNVRAVVTYNFDNLLTEAINILYKDQVKYFTSEEREHLIERNPQDRSNASNDELDKKSFSIYHIHGYIPPPTELYLNKNNEIVLSMEEYYDNFGNLLSWQTSSQLHFLSNYTCIFAGLSLSDLTPQRMIHIAHKQNKSKRLYYLKAAGMENNNDFSNTYLSLMNIKNSFLANYGLAPIFEKGSYKELFTKFNQVFDIIREQWDKSNNT